MSGEAGDLRRAAGRLAGVLAGVSTEGGDVSSSGGADGGVSGAEATRGLTAVRLRGALTAGAGGGAPSAFTFLTAGLGGAATLSGVGEGLT